MTTSLEGQESRRTASQYTGSHLRAVKVGWADDLVGKVLAIKGGGLEFGSTELT